MPQVDLVPTQPRIHQVSGVLSMAVRQLGVKLPAHLHLAAKVKNERHYTSVLTIRPHGVDRDNTVFNGIFKQASITPPVIYHSMYITILCHLLHCYTISVADIVLSSNV
jgi:hypothetical protein